MSSVWRGSTKDVKILWCTILSLADKDGIVEMNPLGLANAADLTLEEMLAALETLKSPDPMSSTEQHEGRRVEVIGRTKVVVLNYAFYQARFMSERRKAREAERSRRNRAKSNEKTTPYATVRNRTQQSPTQTQTQTQTQTEEKPVGVTREGAPQQAAEPAAKTNWRLPPEDWTPLPALMERATERGLDAELELEKFRTFEQRQVPTDWNLPFKRWVLTATPRPAAKVPDVQPTIKWKPGMR